ncbi:MAG: hypothetical protein LAO18_20785 [Acidobacteriia bacterium]|nr:hypothetical protein [Terriglobia bacterium]
MRLLRRILVTLAITSAVVFVGVEWIAPVALSYYGARKAPAVARVVPTELKDQTVSQASGSRLSYFGYEFEVPWNDLDEAQTKLYPKDKPTRVVLVFQSGLRLMITALPARELINGISGQLKTSPNDMDAIFGHEAMMSDYNFVKTLYEFTPDTMHHWSISSRTFGREATLLILKSLAPAKCAETGIFKVQNQRMKGFQQGNAETRENGVVVDLYSDEGGLELIFAEKNYKSSAGVTQPEINRIIQSMHKAI